MGTELKGWGVLLICIIIDILWVLCKWPHLHCVQRKACWRDGERADILLYVNNRWWHDGSWSIRLLVVHGAHVTLLLYAYALPPETIFSTCRLLVSMVYYIVYLTRQRSFALTQLFLLSVLYDSYYFHLNPFSAMGDLWHHIKIFFSHLRVQ